MKPLQPPHSAALAEHRKLYAKAWDASIWDAPPLWMRYFRKRREFRKALKEARRLAPRGVLPAAATEAP